MAGRGSSNYGAGGEWDLLFGSPEDAQAKAQALAAALRGQQQDALALQALTGGPRVAPQIGQTLAQNAQQELGGLGQAAGERLRMAMQQRVNDRLAAQAEASLGQQQAHLSETARHNKAMERVNAALAGGSLSPEARDMLAQQVLTTGVIPQVGAGRAGAGLKTMVLNRAAELGPDANLAGAKAAYHADTASLGKMQAQADAVNAFERTAMANLDRFLETAKGAVDTSSPLFNMPARKFQEKVAGDPRMTQFNVARQVAVQEVGKVLSGAMGSAAISDSARHEVEQLLSPDASLAQIQAAADILRQDMHNRKAAYAAEIAGVRTRASGQPKSAPETAPPVDAEALRKKYGL